MDIALQIEVVLAELKGKPVPMNIDGASAVIYTELGFAPEQARGLFCLSGYIFMQSLCDQHCLAESKIETK